MIESAQITKWRSKKILHYCMNIILCYYGCLLYTAWLFPSIFFGFCFFSPGLLQVYPSSYLSKEANNIPVGYQKPSRKLVNPRLCRCALINYEHKNEQGADQCYDKGGVPFWGPFFAVTRSHSREWHTPCSFLWGGKVGCYFTFVTWIPNASVRHAALSVSYNVVSSFGYRVTRTSRMAQVPQRKMGYDMPPTVTWPRSARENFHLITTGCMFDGRTGLRSTQKLCICSPSTTGDKKTTT